MKRETRVCRYRHPKDIDDDGSQASNDSLAWICYHEFRIPCSFLPGGVKLKCSLCLLVVITLKCTG